MCCTWDDDDDDDEGKGEGETRYRHIGPPLWSRDNVVYSYAAGPDSIPGQVNFLVEVFPWFFLNTVRQMSGNLLLGFTTLFNMLGNHHRFRHIA